MKNLNRILSLVFSLAAPGFLFVYNSDKAFMFGWASILLAIIFMCFAIMEEQKEEIERLRKKIMNAGREEKGDLEIFTDGDGRKYFRMK